MKYDPGFVARAGLPQRDLTQAPPGDHRAEATTVSIRQSQVYPCERFISGLNREAARWAGTRQAIRGGSLIPRGTTPSYIAGKKGMDLEP